MVPRRRVCRRAERYFPRIRGDGPDELARNLVNFTFSPYSRGWSQGGQAADTCIIIFPVFAGMVPVAKREWVHPLHFPRIRGDGPKKQNLHDLISPFSPYSRGWSLVRPLCWVASNIFPVFAGMVPRASAQVGTAPNFPRIRGDDPSGNSTEKCIDGDIAAL